MILEFENVPKEVSLHKWHRVYSLNNELCEGLYICFKYAWDLDGNRLESLPAGSHVIVEAYFNGVEYP